MRFIRGPDFVSRTVEFPPITFFLCKFFQPKFLRSKAEERDAPNQNQYLQEPVPNFKPKRYNENQFSAYIAADLQACRLDPLQVLNIT